MAEPSLDHVWWNCLRVHRQSSRFFRRSQMMQA